MNHLLCCAFMSVEKSVCQERITEKLESRVKQCFILVNSQNCSVYVYKTKFISTLYLTKYYEVIL